MATTTGNVLTYEHIYIYIYITDHSINDISCVVLHGKFTTLANKIELMLVTSKRSKHLRNLPTSITMGNAQIPFKQSEKFGFYIRLSSYYECTCLQN